MKPLYLIGLLASATSLWAGESVLLQTGFTLHADRHEIVGDKVVIYAAGGVTEMPASMVTGFEMDEIAPPALELVTAEPQALAAQPAPVIDNDPRHLAEEAARRFALPESFVKSVMRAESGFQPSPQYRPKAPWD